VDGANVTNGAREAEDRPAGGKLAEGIRIGGVKETRQAAKGERKEGEIGREREREREREGEREESTSPKRVGAGKASSSARIPAVTAVKAVAAITLSTCDAIRRISAMIWKPLANPCGSIRIFA
jgi:hypothetical protein